MIDKDLTDEEIDLVLDDTVRDISSLLFLIATHSDPRLIEAWVDKTYDTLRDRLAPEDRIRAIILLLNERAMDAADRLEAAPEHIPAGAS